MVYNQANCDIYIGKDAGKKRLKDIRNASKSIKVVSPYYCISKNEKEIRTIKKTHLRGCKG